MMDVRCFVLAGLLLSLVPSAAMAQEITEFEDYVVKPGDTCTSIAEKFFGDKRRYDFIHAYNDLSADSHACVAGRKLKIAKIPPVPDALLGQKGGEVRARGPEQADWNDAQTGMDLYSAWRLNTLEKAKAEIAFQDTSTLIMSANTLVVIYGQSQEKSKIVPAHTVLETGRLRSRLDELAGVKIESPSSTAELGSGQAQVTVEEDGLTRVENHLGGSAKVVGKAGGEVSVKEGMGTRIKVNQKPEPPRPLPPTPVWTGKDDVVLGFKGIGATIILEWKPVKVAESYYVELAKDARGVNVVESVFVPGDKTRLEVKGVPAGTYYAVVSAVDADKFESVPTAVRHIRTALVVMPNGSINLDDTGAKHVVLGTKLRAPRGMTCRTTADGEFVEKTAFVTEGGTSLECKIGDLVGLTSVVVDAPTAKRADERELALGQYRIVKLAFDPSAPSDVVFEGDGLEVDSAMPIEGGYAVRVRATDDTKATLRAHYGSVALGSFDYKVGAPTEAKLIEPDVYYLQLMAGYAYYDGLDALEVGAAGASIHIQGAVIPTKYIGLAASIGAGQYDAAVLDWRAQVLVGLFENDARPFVSLGVGGLMVEDHITDFHAGIGLMPSINEHFGWSFDTGAIFTSESGSIDAVPQARAGLWWSFR